MERETGGGKDWEELWRIGRTSSKCKEKAIRT
jgi:hypothetical protein